MSKIYHKILAKIKVNFTKASLAMYKKEAGGRLLFLIFLLVSCSAQHKAQQNILENKPVLTSDVLTNNLLTDSVLAHALVGVCVYDVEAKKYIHQYNDEKYFVPASNTKLFTCYAAMKYLGDSLVGLRYKFSNDNLIISGTGDPTFLYSDFANQPVYNFLKGKTNIQLEDDKYLTQFSPLGDGWAWNDYWYYYMPERSEFPIYGNCVNFFMQADTVAVVPHAFYQRSIIGLNQKLKNKENSNFIFAKSIEENSFQPVYQSDSKFKFSHQYVPFKTLANPTFPNKIPTSLQLLSDTLGNESAIKLIEKHDFLPNVIHSQPTDSLLKITMHRSDNFLAEQTLLMVSNEKLGFMSDEKIIDTLLKTDLKDLPQKPSWVDGSGLSRYDLFTPQDFVYILEKMKNEFGLARLQNILPTGNTGTLSGLYKNLNGKIFAKTGTLGNQVALSGFLTTQKGKLLIFSILVNNHMNSAGNVRKAVEKFLNQVWESRADQ